VISLRYFVVLIGLGTLLLGMMGVIRTMQRLPFQNEYDGCRTQPQQCASALDRLPSSANVPAHVSDLYGFFTMMSAYHADPTKKKVLFLKAKQALEYSLSVTPINSFAFAWLAAVRWHLLTPPSSILEAWRFSILTSPFESKLLIFRAELGLLLYHSMTQEDQQLLKQQLIRGCLMQCSSVIKLLAVYHQPQWLDMLPTDKIAAQKGFSFFSRQQ
jgi:hypothetical protein